MSYAILRIKKLKTAGSVQGAGAHIFRLNPTPNADPLRPISLLHGSNDLLSDVKARLPEKTRSNAVFAVEMVMSASPEWFKNGGSVEQWTDHCLAWLEATYGKNCVSACLHADELTPNLHAVIVPIKPNGRLSCDHFFGTPEKQSRLQSDYAASMKPLGLLRGLPKAQTKREHQPIRRFYGLCNAVEHAGIDVSRVIEDAYRTQQIMNNEKGREAAQPSATPRKRIRGPR